MKENRQSSNNLSIRKPEEGSKKKREEQKWNNDPKERKGKWM